MSRRGVGAEGLTERDRFWRGHLRALEARDSSAKDYAAERGLSVHALYQARKRLVALSAWPERAAQPQFTRVALAAAPAAAGGACRVRLASGAVVEWTTPPALEVLVALVR